MGWEEGSGENMTLIDVRSSISADLFVIEGRDDQQDSHKFEDCTSEPGSMPKMFGIAGVLSQSKISIYAFQSAVSNLRATNTQ